MRKRVRPMVPAPSNSPMPDKAPDAEARALFRQNSDSQGWSRGSTVMTVPGLDGLVSSTNSRLSMGAGQKAARPSVLGAMVSDFGDDEAANAEIDVDDVEAHSEIKGYNELMENRQQQEEEVGTRSRRQYERVDKSALHLGCGLRESDGPCSGATGYKWRS